MLVLIFLNVVLRLAQMGIAVLVHFDAKPRSDLNFLICIGVPLAVALYKSLNVAMTVKIQRNSRPWPVRMAGFFLCFVTGSVSAPYGIDLDAAGPLRQKEIGACRLRGHFANPTGIRPKKQLCGDCRHGAMLRRVLRNLRRAPIPT